MARRKYHAACADGRDPRDYAKKSIEDTLALARKQEEDRGKITTQCVSPGKMVRMYMDDRNMSIKALSRVINHSCGRASLMVSEDTIKDLLDDKIEVDYKLAKRLENTFGVSKEEWLTTSYYYRKELKIILLQDWHDKIKGEKTRFEVDMLGKKKMQILKSAYKINAYDNISMFLEEIEDKECIDKLISIDDLIETIYMEYLKLPPSDKEEFDSALKEILEHRR